VKLRAFPVTRHRIAVLRDLTPSDWAALGEAMGVIAWTSLALRVAKFPTVFAWATRLRPGNAAREYPRDRVVRLSWLVMQAARFLRVKCLTRSVALARLLASRGVASELRIGVMKDAGMLNAHAWVEWNGVVLNDRPHCIAQYAAFDRALGGMRNG
jgi:hypothetical protein